MKEREVFVPLLVWLIGGAHIGGTYNDYCGSVTQDPSQPMWGQKIFNYRISVETLEDREILRAAWFPGVQSFQNTPEEDVVSRTFEAEEESRAEIRDWLTEEMAAFFDD